MTEDSARSHTGARHPWGSTPRPLTPAPLAPGAGSARRERYAAGDLIGGKYRLTAVLGEGGMGAVWLARNLTLDVDVAIKLIRRDVATPETSQRLLQEARAAARLGHPSIVRVFDFGVSEQGDPFMVMEVLYGELLSEVLDRKGRLAATNAAAMLLPVISALDASHSKGIIHRDLKPENILLVSHESGSMTPKVLDFGVAKLRREDGKDRRLTQGRTVMGTPDYMSPEQACGEADIDGRTDLWTLCVILYEAIAGRRPFGGRDVRTLFTSIVTARPTPTTELGAGDEALWEILKRGLAKDRDKRWHTMRELGAALAQWCCDRGVENDVAGTSITAHWLTGRRPLSEAPPPNGPDTVREHRGEAGPGAAETLQGEGRAPADHAVGADADGAEDASPRPRTPTRSRPSKRSPRPPSSRVQSGIARMVTGPEGIANEATDGAVQMLPVASSRPRGGPRWQWFAIAVPIVGMAAFTARAALYAAFVEASPTQPAPPVWTHGVTPTPPPPPPAAATAALSPSATDPRRDDPPPPASSAVANANVVVHEGEDPMTTSTATGSVKPPTAPPAKGKTADKGPFPIPAKPNF